MGKAADLVEQAVHETLTYYGFPDIHWQKIRTNNPLERIMREIRRRTRVVGVPPAGRSASPRPSREPSRQDDPESGPHQSGSPDPSAYHHPLHSSDCSFLILEGAANPESAKDSVRYPGMAITDEFYRFLLVPGERIELPSNGLQN